MSRQKAETIEHDGVKYRVRQFDGHVVGVREVKPGGWLHPGRYEVHPHPETGKRRAGWRLEWILLALGLAALYGGAVAYVLGAFA